MSEVKCIEAKVHQRIGDMVVVRPNDDTLGLMNVPFYKFKYANWFPGPTGLYLEEEVLIITDANGSIETATVKALVDTRRVLLKLDPLFLKAECENVLGKGLTVKQQQQVVVLQAELFTALGTMHPQRLASLTLWVNKIGNRIGKAIGYGHDELRAVAEAGEEPDNPFFLFAEIVERPPNDFASIGRIEAMRHMHRLAKRNLLKWARDKENRPDATTREKASFVLNESENWLREYAPEYLGIAAG